MLNVFYSCQCSQLKDLDQKSFKSILDVTQFVCESFWNVNLKGQILVKCIFHRIAKSLIPNGHNFTLFCFILHNMFTKILFLENKTLRNIYFCETLRI